MKCPRSGVIDQEKIYTHDFCYQCSKYRPEFLFGKLRIRHSTDEPCFPSKIKSLSSQIKMNKLFNNIYEINIRRCDKNIHWGMVN